MPVLPNEQFWMLIYGGYGYDAGALYSSFNRFAAGMSSGGNPPYTVNDFLAVYPKFMGTPTAVNVALATGNASVQVSNSAGLAMGQLITGSGIPNSTTIQAWTYTTLEPIGDLTAGSNLIENVTSTMGLLVGQPIAGGSIPAGCTIAAFTVNTITIAGGVASTSATGIELSITQVNVTLSNAATATQTSSASIYQSPLLPLAVLQLYINLASASIMYSRWKGTWPLAMALYVAHFATLWLQSDGNPQTTPGQAVASALQTGVLVSESADGVSAGFQALSALDSWAAWGLTTYGAQLVTFARAVGAGAAYFR